MDCLIDWSVNMWKGEFQVGYIDDFGAWCRGLPSHEAPQMFFQIILGARASDTLSFTINC